LGLEYDGAGFHGWQSQASGRGVQDSLEQALAGIGGVPTRLHAAGRTDRGVHASMQVAHFDPLQERPVQAWVRGVNALLPRELAVRWACPVSSDFHARFSALARSYSYLLLNAPTRPALAHRRAGWFHSPLDVEAMRAGARLLLGEHDFSAFRGAQCQAATPVRTLHELSIERCADYLRFDLRANAFLHHMVRNIVGSLVYVGAHRQPPEWLAELLSGRDRNRAAPTFAADGLYLTGVEYDGKWGLPETCRTLRIL